VKKEFKLLHTEITVRNVYVLRVNDTLQHREFRLRSNMMITY